MYGGEEGGRDDEVACESEGSVSSRGAKEGCGGGGRTVLGGLEAGEGQDDATNGVRVSARRGDLLKRLAGSRGGEQRDGDRARSCGRLQPDPVDDGGRELARDVGRGERQREERAHLTFVGLVTRSANLGFRLTSPFPPSQPSAQAPLACRAYMPAPSAGTGASSMGRLERRTREKSARWRGWNDETTRV